jgi:putative FmdB family regulatory protein
MPTYVYRCAKCKHQFEKVMSVAEHDKARPPCPKCGGRKVEHVLAGFTAMTSRKS